MSNICTMSITFYCNPDEEKSQQGLLSLHKRIQDAFDNKGGAFSALLNPQQYPDISVRGEFSYVDDLDEKEIMFSAHADTDWDPLYDFLHTLCKECGVFFASSSDEPGFGIFQTYGDPEGVFYPHNFSVDICGTDGISEDDNAPDIKDAYEFFDTSEEMVSWLNGNYGELFQSESYEEWEEFLDEYEAGHIRIWEHYTDEDYEVPDFYYNLSDIYEDKRCDALKEEYMQTSEVVFSEFLRCKLTEGVKLSEHAIQCLLEWSGETGYVSVTDLVVE